MRTALCYNFFMKKHLIWISELLLWIFIIIVLIMSMFLYKHLKLKEKHSYHVFFADANGIRDGSPVKIMGNEIGYVSNVRVIDNSEIFVSFVITKPQINIPAGTVANIESTGIVGSRSLELYPPTKPAKKGSELIIPTNPNRVQGAFSNSSRTAEIIYTASSSFNKTINVEQIPIIRRFIRKTYNETNSYGTKIDEINEAQNEAIKLIQDNKKIKDFNKKMENLSK